MNTENNKLIADATKYLENGKNSPYYYAMKHAYDSDSLKYDTDWNWLMGAVDHIESLTAIDGRGEVNFVVTIEPGYCAISQGGENPIIESQLETRIASVYDAVVRFFKWHNTQPK